MFSFSLAEMICLNMLKVVQQTRKQLLMTNGLTDNLDVTRLLEKSLIKT